MSLDLTARAKPPYGLMALVVAQVICAIFFVGDVLADFSLPAVGDPHLSIELVAGIVLLVTVVVEIRIIARILRRQAHLQRAASTAAAAITEVIEAHFTAWQLTPSEHDIANLLVKGLSISEIASVRGSAEGTVKSHLNAIYRKSGAQNRGELLSLIIDSLMARDATG